jgi:hypothetical protein
MSYLLGCGLIVTRRYFIRSGEKETVKKEGRRYRQKKFEEESYREAVSYIYVFKVWGNL